MRAGIHPELFECRVSCSGCGAEFATFTTRSEIRVEICSQCHPFFTGKQARIVDTEGRVEKFIRKFEGKEARVSKRKRKQAAAATERAAMEEREARLAAEKEAEEKARREEARRKRAEERAARKAAQEREEEAADAPEAGAVSPEPEAAPVAAETPPDPPPAPQAAGEDAGGAYAMVDEELKKIAKAGKTAYYSDIAPLAGLAPDSKEFRIILTGISRDEHKAGRPLLSVVVVGTDKGIPGPGFFTLAKELGLMQGEDQKAFFEEELKKVHEQWR